MRVGAHDFERLARPVLDRVFASLDPFGEPFRERIQARALIYPTDETLEVGDDYLAAVCWAADQVGDPDIFVTSTEVPDPSGRGLETWFVPEALRESLCTLPIPATETAYYGGSGSWGVLVSHEFHAVIGGSGDFIAAFFSRTSQTQAAMRERFVENWQRNSVRFGSDLGWLPRLLAHTASPLEHSNGAPGESLPE